VLAQAIGRWGNFINQELYGAPTTLPWGLEIDAAYRILGYTDPALRFHPLFLYESLGNILICLGLFYLARRYSQWLKDGDLFIIYLIAYPILRFSLDFLRLDNNQVLGLNTNQVILLVVAIASAFWLGHRVGLLAGASPSPRAATRIEGDVRRRRSGHGGAAHDDLASGRWPPGGVARRMMIWHRAWG